MGLISGTKKVAHGTHRILKFVSPTYKMTSNKLSKSAKNRKQRKMKERIKKDYKGRHR
jgi:hypothetical protein